MSRFQQPIWRHRPSVYNLTCFSMFVSTFFFPFYFIKSIISFWKMLSMHENREDTRSSEEVSFPRVFYGHCRKTDSVILDYHGALHLLVVSSRKGHSYQAHFSFWLVAQGSQGNSWGYQQSYRYASQRQFNVSTFKHGNQEKKNTHTHTFTGLTMFKMTPS